MVEDDIVRLEADFRRRFHENGQRSAKFCEILRRALKRHAQCKNQSDLSGSKTVLHIYLSSLY